mmetsp:Transcript_33373/g.83209  ORF Transcript_33373/g.83209 Transcript_33373/m.83209 type:complete len:87 (-) Transcript_33373:103-363(-)
MHMLAFAAGEALRTVHACDCAHLTHEAVGVLSYHRPKCELISDIRVIDILHDLRLAFEGESTSGSPATGQSHGTSPSRLELVGLPP